MKHTALYVARKENDLYQKDMAVKLGMSSKSYYLKESGKRDFTLTECRMLAQIFDCTLNDLFQEGYYDHTRTAP